MGDVSSYIFCLIAFTFHFAGYTKNYQKGPLVITPQFNDSHFEKYCPFNLSKKKYLVVAQACFHNLFILFNSSFYETQQNFVGFLLTAHPWLTSDLGLMVLRIKLHANEFSK